MNFIWQDPSMALGNVILSFVLIVLIHAYILFFLFKVSKRRLTMMLYRYGYIGRILDAQTKKLYFSLTDKGLEATEAFLKNHKKPFARRNKNVTPTIVKID